MSRGALLATTILLAICQVRGEDGTSKSATGANIRTQSLSKTLDDRGISAIEILLDHNRINSANAKRSPKAFSSAPELFGPKKEFPPLFLIEAMGPGRIKILGDGPTEEVNIPVENHPQRIEVYPNYSIEKMEAFGGKKENFKISFDDGEKTSEAVEPFEITWSGTNEIFLSQDRTSDLVGFTKPKKTSERKLNTWIEKSLKAITKKGILYEAPEESPESGWQKIKTEGEIVRSGSANCLDLTVYLARKASEAGLAAYIILMEKHALIAVGEKDASFGNCQIIETTLLLISEKNPEPSEKTAIKAGEKTLQEEYKKNPTGTKIIEVSAWREIYR